MLATGSADEIPSAGVCRVSVWHRMARPVRGTQGTCHAVAPTTARCSSALGRRPPRPACYLRPVSAVIYKICGAAEWRQAEAEGVYRGSADDVRDGYVHFSLAGQVAATAARHFGSRSDLVLVAVHAGALGKALRYEPSRGGVLFPHLYGELSMAAVVWVKEIGWDGEKHLLPDLG